MTSAFDLSPPRNRKPTQGTRSASMPKLQAILLLLSAIRVDAYPGMEYGAPDPRILHPASYTQSCNGMCTSGYNGNFPNYCFVNTFESSQDCHDFCASWTGCAASSAVTDEDMGGTRCELHPLGSTYAVESWCPTEEMNGQPWRWSEGTSTVPYVTIASCSELNLAGAYAFKYTYSGNPSDYFAHLPQLKKRTATNDHPFLRIPKSTKIRCKK